MTTIASGEGWRYPSGASASPLARALLGLFDTLQAGDEAAVLALFAGTPQLNTPLAGSVQGEAALRAFVVEQHAWLNARSARSQPINLIDSVERVVVELVLDLAFDSARLELPVAIAAECAGEALAALRVYHSTWPLNGDHRVRAPLLPIPATLPEEPTLIRAYMDALEHADQGAILGLFVADGYVREPSGAQFRHTGPAARQAFYRTVLGTGGVVLHHHTVTFDGRSCAVEYTCDQWGRTVLPPQAGIAVYDLAGADRLQAVRIYDDILPPLPDT